jgi:hypothetical protein
MPSFAMDALGNALGRDHGPKQLHKERLLNVEKEGAKVRHTFPVTNSAHAMEEGVQEESVRGGWPGEVSSERETR